MTDDQLAKLAREIVHRLVVPGDGEQEKQEERKFVWQVAVSQGSEEHHDVIHRDTLGRVELRRSFYSPPGSGWEPFAAVHDPDLGSIIYWRRKVPIRGG